MCIIIDANVFSSVFVPTALNHDQFEPVLEWIIKKKGKITFGGTQYKMELARSDKIRRLFVELEKKSKITKIDSAQVDNVQENLSKSFPQDDFDDYHIVAIVIVSKSKLICSENSHHFKYFKKKEFYPNRRQVPLIYHGIDNTNLLSSRHCKGCVHPCHKISKEDAAYLLKQIDNISR